MHHPPAKDWSAKDGSAKDGAVTNDAAVSHSDISQAPEDILAYWTPERMAGAKPREVRLPEPDRGPDTEPEADAGTE
jgi:hypothetical protein